VKSSQCITCWGRPYYPRKYKDGKQNVDLTIQQMTGFIEMVKGRRVDRDKALLAVFFLTGARPNEIALMKKEDLTMDEENPGFYAFRLHNSKLGKVRHFIVRTRTLPISADSAFMPEILQYTAKVSEGAFLFPLTTRRMEQIWDQATDGYACPYTARHQRLVEVSARTGGDLTELLNWKGSVDIKSITPYLAGRKVKPAKIG